MDMLTSYLPVTSNKLHSISEKDTLLQTVKKFIKSRWPDLRLLRQHADWSQLEGFYRRHGSLTIEQGCGLFRERVIIPTTLRSKILKLLHQGHPGIQRMKSLARNYAYWPGMDRNIEENGSCMQALCSSSKAACQSNTALVASRNKTMGAHSHRLCWPTSGKTLSHHSGCLL
jgi:hypothetical protein